MAVANLFLSAVSAEFASYREALRRDLTRAEVSVAVQEDFTAGAGETLAKLDDYLRACDAVIHVVGDMSGAPALAPSVAAIRSRCPDLGERFPVLAPFLADKGAGLPYTQWEAWLALYHRRLLVICAPEAGAPRDPRFVADDAQRQAQQEHLARLASVERYVEFRFADAARLAIEVLRSPLGELIRRAGAAAPNNLPLRPNLFFTGRDALMLALARALGTPPRDAHAPATVVVLSGLGGVGKSRLALEFAWAHAGAYSALLFVAAADGEALERSLAGLARPEVLALPEHEAREQPERIAAVLRWLRAHPGWLLIADNVDSEDAAAALEARLAALAGGQVLVTSRLGPERWNGAVKLLRVDELAPAAAAAFLLERTAGRRRPHGDDEQLARRIADELGRLPLALEQAGAYVARLKLTLAAYLQQWETSRDQLLGWFDPRVMGYPRSVAATWQTSVAQLTPPALRLLQRLAWLAPEPVPESLLEVRVGDDDPVAEAGLAALADLAAFSLVRRDDALPRFGIHRLVQEVTRAGLDEALRGETLVEALAWVDVAFQGDPWDVRSWPALDPLLPHAEEVAWMADRLGGPSTIAAALMNEVALMMQAKAMYVPAEPLLRRALALVEASVGAAHPGVAQALNNLAALLQATNRLTEAESMMRRALTIDEAHFGPDHPSVARELNNLAQLLQDTNRLAEAEPLMRRALAIDEASFGPEHPKIAIRLNNLAQLMKATSRLAEAEPLMRRALATDEATFGPEHPNVARHLSNLAALLQATNRLADAEPLIRRALAIDEVSLGPKHPNVAIRLNNLAQLLQDTNRLAEAEPLMRRALAIDEVSFGPEHPKLAVRLNNLAMLLLATERLAEAEPLMRRALAIDEASFGAGHPDVAIDLNNLAQLLADTDRLAEAEPMMRRALAIDEASFGMEHPNVAIRLNNLATLLYNTERLAEAEPLMRRALAIDQSSLGAGHPKVALRLGNLAQLLQAMERSADAEPLMRRALAIDEASFGAGHPNVALRLNNLALLLWDTDRLAEAEPMMRRAYLTMAAALGPDHSSVQTVRDNCAELLRAQGRDADAVLRDLQSELPPR